MGTFTVISSAVPVPEYTAGRLIDESPLCKHPYITFNYNTAPILRELIIGLGVNPEENNLMETYTGNPYKFLNIINFTAVLTPIGGALPGLSKLFYMGTEVTSFPMSPIDIEGLGAGDSFGIEIGQQILPDCAAGRGYRITLTYSITDVNGVEGEPVSYIIEVSYQP